MFAHLWLATALAAPSTFSQCRHLPLLVGFHRREPSLGDLLNRSCVGGPTGLKIFPVTNSLDRMK
jgi:hypothetical protein